MANQGVTKFVSAKTVLIDLSRIRRSSLHEDLNLPAGTVEVTLRADNSKELESMDIGDNGVNGVYIIQRSTNTFNQTSVGGSSFFNNISFGNVFQSSVSSVSQDPPTMDIDIRIAAGLDVTLSLQSGVDMDAGDFSGQFSASVASSARLRCGRLSGPRVEIDAASSAQMVSTEIATSKLSIDGSSSSRVSIVKVVARKVSADVSSNSRVDIEGGNIEALEVDASSSSQFRFRGFAGSAELDVSSSAEISILEVSGKISQDRSSGGKVKIG